LRGDEGPSVATTVEKSTSENDVVEKLKQVTAQVAIRGQSFIPLSQGLTARGQQSMPSTADIPAISVGLALATVALTGSMATEMATNKTAI